jgi:hypothetical protein
MKDKDAPISPRDFIDETKTNKCEIVIETKSHE